MDIRQKIRTVAASGIQWIKDHTLIVGGLIMAIGVIGFILGCYLLIALVGAGAVIIVSDVKED